MNGDLISASRRGEAVAEVGDDLLLRHASPRDTEALVHFNARVHARPGAAEPDAWIAAWTRNLLENPHPTVDVADFLVVEDTRTGAVVSSLNLISQTWSFGGEPVGVGRVELVGTHPDYRSRGLVRRQFEVLHAWSAARGELIQAITGIHGFYRQFGYEYALPDRGGRHVARADIPARPADIPARPADIPAGPADGGEPFRVRRATLVDVPFLMAVDTTARTRYLVSCIRDAATWRYEIAGYHQRDAHRPRVGIVEDRAGAPAGYVVHAGLAPDGRLWVIAYELAAGVSWLEATPSVLRSLDEAARHSQAQPDPAGAGGALLDVTPPDTTAPGATRPAPGAYVGLYLRLGAEHPSYPWLPDGWPPVAPPAGPPDAVPPGAWYVRVPDLPAFLRRVAPVLEGRIAASGAVGLTAELRLSFYRAGLRLAFERGRLLAAEPWTPAREQAVAMFPGLTFLPLLFGYRSLGELRYAFPDCALRDGHTAALLEILFPKQASLIWPVR